MNKSQLIEKIIQMNKCKKCNYTDSVRRLLLVEEKKARAGVHSCSRKPTCSHYMKVLKSYKILKSLNDLKNKTNKDKIKKLEDTIFEDDHLLHISLILQDPIYYLNNNRR